MKRMDKNPTMVTKILTVNRATKMLTIKRARKIPSRKRSSMKL